MDTQTTWQTGDVVTFWQNADIELTGTIIRVWNKPAADPYVTIVTDDTEPGRTFVRCSSTVREA